MNDEALMNIGHYGRTSNYRLRHEPVKLTNRVFKGHRPDGDGYEEIWEESDEVQRYRLSMRVRGARKQRAAKANIPKESIKLVPINQPKPAAVVLAILDKKTPEQIRVLELEAELKKLMGLLK
jgi:hypothetical protein